MQSRRPFFGMNAHSRNSSLTSFLSLSHVDSFPVYDLTLSPAPSFFLLLSVSCGPSLLCLYHHPSRVSPTHVLRSRSCRRCAPMSCILILYMWSLHLVKCFSPSFVPPTFRWLVVLGDVSKYIIPPRAFSHSFLSLSLSCHLGGVILICGVRICKVAIFIVQYS